jgi:hypothetical protein
VARLGKLGTDLPTKRAVHAVRRDDEVSRELEPPGTIPSHHRDAAGFCPAELLDGNSRPHALGRKRLQKDPVKVTPMKEHDIGESPVAVVSSLEPAAGRCP